MFAVQFLFESNKIYCFCGLFLLLNAMQMEKRMDVIKESTALLSDPLGRNVLVDVYLPVHFDHPHHLSLLLINDGQDLVAMAFQKILGELYHHKLLSPLVVVGIHCGEDRKNEYGMISSPDFKGRGAKAGLYQRFVFEELLPHIYSAYKQFTFKETAFAGFSLGGLSALDLAWNNHQVFSKTGVFSGSLWWRSKSKTDKDFHEATDRLMHQQIRNSTIKPHIKFFFQCGELDESEDRNNNGVIDSIDDTVDLMRELLAKGYKEGTDFHYLQLRDGKHDVPTWARSLPDFLKWGWGK